MKQFCVFFNKQNYLICCIIESVHGPDHSFEQQWAIKSTLRTLILQTYSHTVSRKTGGYGIVQQLVL